ncbi:hypothetical protein DMA12_19470 [Amycolatopsis balhimycina DSM 5908]|uniref:DUF5666 domain-containing protein n=1 Tax=Amycolatopsis balhimycina DSM 5908 TaxID=1081091 RepID=A0A428WK76_AMYBA|nr:hypothetical protein [Amycolatopsis balhimycina]RSM43430.1 hypothetical protein DMA12_19470 [Amycolatopsis balhimycina DSM 5908]
MTTPNTPPEGGPAPAANTPAPGEPAPANWGDPAAAPPRKGWSGKKTAIAAGIAVVIAAGGGAAIWAGTSSADNSAQQGPGGFGGPGGQFRGQGMPGGGFGGGMTALRDALHGDFVVANGSGGYTTERLQTGDVTELSATSVTLTSKDGYKQTYTIDSSTQKTGDVKTGDTNITVVAKVDGQTATATSLGKGFEQGQRQPGQRRNGGGTYSARPTS